MGRLLPEECPHGKIIDPGDFDATVEPCEICDLLPWISVEHKKPAQYQAVLGYFPEYKSLYEQEVCFLSGSIWRHPPDEEAESAPTHWMELFEPPKAKQ